jgi:ABC-type nitrate/sulfonate/bicarbonate transport system substrate-binding protein
MNVAGRLKLVSIALIASCFVHAASAKDLLNVSIGVGSPSLPAAAARIADVMGLFEKHGLKAKVLPMDNASVAMMGLISGSLDFTTAGGPDVVMSQSRGQKVIAISSVYHGFAGQLVVSSAVVKKLNLSAQAPLNEKVRALDELVIASPSATSPYTFALRSAAATAGINVRIIYISQAAMPAALETGAIQAFVSSSPYYARPIVNGSGVLWLSGPKGEFPKSATPANSVTLNTRADFAANHIDLVNRVIAVFRDFSQAVSDRPDQVKAAIAKLFPDLDAPTRDLLFASESTGWKTEVLTAEDMSREIGFVKSTGVPLPGVDSLNPKDLLLR